MIQASIFNDIKYRIETISGADLSKMYIDANKPVKKFFKKMGLYKRSLWKLNSAEFLLLYIFIC